MEAAASAPVHYAESLESSPRSRHTDSWDVEPSSSGGSARLRLMCSYGGRIVPRPHDKSLCYVGGTTRMVVVDRRDSLAVLSAKLSSSLLDGRRFSLKYQLPNEDLDSLISVSGDEDLANMIEEYDRILAASASPSSSSRIRLFIFPPPNPESASVMKSLLQDSKSEAWFVDALNGAGVLPRSASADSSADANCFLGLDEGTAGGSVASACSKHSLVTDSPSPGSGKPGKIGQEISYVPDSPMKETMSSFGSTSSASCLSNVPSIPVHIDGCVRPHSPRSEHEDQLFHANAASGAPPASISPIRAFSDEERLEQVKFRKPLQPPPLPLQKISAHEFPNNAISRDGNNSSGSVPRQKTGYHREPMVPIPPKERSSPPAVVASVSDPKRDIKDPTILIPMQVQDPGFALPVQQLEHQQFVHQTSHYIHQHATAPVPISPYYQIRPSHQQQPPPLSQIDPQYPMYFVPMGQNQAYGLSITPNLPDPPANLSSNPTAIGNPAISLPPQNPQELAANLCRTASPHSPAATAAAPLMQLSDQQQQQYLGYRLHHPTQQMAAVTAAGNFAYDFADPLQAQLYYAQQTATNLTPQYQALSAGVVMSEAPLPPHSMSNAK